MTELFYDDVSVGDHIPTLTVTVDETQMFFFSAATYNGHRIHYDKEWARAEGYDDVLVHGPLQAALLARALGDWIGGRGRLVSFSVQNQLHGGMGYVTETDLHLWSERARLGSTLGGGADVAASWLEQTWEEIGE